MDSVSSEVGEDWYRIILFFLNADMKTDLTLTSTPNIHDDHSSHHYHRC